MLHVNVYLVLVISEYRSVVIKHWKYPTLKRKSILKHIHYVYPELFVLYFMSGAWFWFLCLVPVRNQVSVL